MPEYEDDLRLWPLPARSTRDRNTQAYFQSEAERIARRFLLHHDAAHPQSIGKRKVIRNVLAPRFRPLTILKRDTYAMGCKVYDRQGTDVLEAYVRRRDAKWRVAHRPRSPTVMDWALRLIRGSLIGEAPHAGLKEPKFLFDAVTQSRAAIELNFAFAHWIKPRHSMMFIEEVGGHEIISAHIAKEKYDFREEDWVNDLRRNKKDPFFSPTQVGIYKKRVKNGPKWWEE